MRDIAAVGRRNVSATDLRALKRRYKAALTVVRTVAVEDRYLLMHAVLWPPQELVEKLNEGSTDRPVSDRQV
jgi:hypothetical protein